MSREGGKGGPVVREVGEGGVVRSWQGEKGTREVRWQDGKGGRMVK